MVSAMTPAAAMSWSRAVSRAMVKLAGVGIDIADAEHGVGDRDAQRLVGDQQRVDLLVDPGRGADPQDPAVEDGELQLQERGLDLSGPLRTASEPGERAFPAPRLKRARGRRG